MSSQSLVDIARNLVGTGRGLLAIDESTTTCDKRFEKLGIPQTVAARRAYRELIITTAGLCEDISGVILYDETVRQEGGWHVVSQLLDRCRDSCGHQSGHGSEGARWLPRRESHRGLG